MHKNLSSIFIVYKQKEEWNKLWDGIKYSAERSKVFRKLKIDKELNLFLSL